MTARAKKTAAKNMAVKKTARAARQRGMVLIFVLGVLALLAMLVASYAVQTSSDIRVAQNHQDSERARLVARAGIERAKFELRRCATTPGYPEPWVVADLWDYSKNAPATLNAPSNILNTTTPSFGAILQGLPTGSGAMTTSNPTGLLLASTANPTGLPWPSGFVGSTYFTYDSTAQFLGDYYTLKVTDCNSVIDVADQNPNIGAMINTLAATLNVGVTPPAVPDAATVGTVIQANRPYHRIEEVQAVLTKNFPTGGPTDYNSLLPYLTCNAYVDNRVITMGSGANLTTAQPRAPINVNMAPYPVLVAALTGITGTTHDGAAWSLTPAQSTALAHAIITYRTNPTLGPGNTTGTNPVTRRYGFASWSEFASFLSTTGGLGPQLTALVLANCNPNTNINKLVPDDAIYQCIDKTDLTGATTELCFEPGGTFLIDSLGLVLGHDGNMEGEAECTSIIRVWSQYNETDQLDFELNRIDPAGNGAAGTTITTAPGLKDFTTLPECRNAWDAQVTADAQTASDGTQMNTTPSAPTTGLNAALWDGQITFNAISGSTLGNQATFAGNIDRTINGAQSGTPNYVSSTDQQFPAPTPPILNYAGVSPTSGARGLNPASPNNTQVCRTLDSGASPVAIGDVLAGTLTAPTWANGSDLHPLAAITGRGANGAGTGNRKLMFLQPQTLTTNAHDYAQVTLSMAVSVTGNLTTTTTSSSTATNTTANGATSTISFSGDITHDSTSDDSATETTNAAYANAGEVSDTGQYDTGATQTAVVGPAGGAGSSSDTTNSSTTVAGTLTATVPPWTVDSLDQQTFQFWFKPGQTIPGTNLYWTGTGWAGGATGQNVMLFSWHSGTPAPPPVAVDSSTPTFGSSLSANAGANSDTSSASGNIAGTNGDGTNASDEGAGGLAAQNTNSNAGDLSTVESSITSDLGGETAQSILWGGECYVVIYLQVTSTGFTLNAEFNMPQKVDPSAATVPSNMSGSYKRDWTYSTTIVPGTWHHVMFPIWVPEASPSTVTSPLQTTGNKNTAFIVDGNVAPSTVAEPAWPTESDPDARLIQAAYQQMISDYNGMYNAFQSLDNADTTAAQNAAATAASNYNANGAQSATATFGTTNWSSESSGSGSGISSYVTASGTGDPATFAISDDSTMTQSVTWSPVTLTGNDTMQDTVGSSTFSKGTIAQPTAYQASNYPIPVRIPPGQSPPSRLITELGLTAASGWTAGQDGVCVWIGGVSPNDTVATKDKLVPSSGYPGYTGTNFVAGCLDFFGLIDNVVIDANLAQTGGQSSRFNTFQPSQPNGSLVNNGASPVYFQKHVPALEWDRPLMVVSQRATFWNGSGGVNLGTVATQFGYVALPTGTTSSTESSLLQTFGAELTTNANPPTPTNAGTVPPGWTSPDYGVPTTAGAPAPSTVPWNTVLNASLLEPRTSGPGGFMQVTSSGHSTSYGFMTQSASGSSPEAYCYAIGITPPAAPPTGGSPPMTPIIDDMKIVYMPWDCAVVLQEENVD